MSGYWASTFCEDCFTCQECSRKVCESRPYCMHQVTCDSCYPTGCGDCIDALDEAEALL